MSLYILSTTLQWDYSDIGDVSEYITDGESYRTDNDEFYIHHLRVKTSTGNIKSIPIIQEPYDSLAIACDIIKTYFGLFAFGYHICNIGDNKYLIREYQNDMRLMDKYPNLSPSFSDEIFLNEVRKCLAFQWLCGFGSFNHSQIVVREHPLIGPHPVVYHQKYKNYKRHNERVTKLWFDGTENMYLEVCHFINNRTNSKISMDIRDILLKYSPDNVGWKTQIIDRIGIAKC
jgi:hypothetical protein